MDMFRPRSDPAQLLYDAFQAEAGNRKGRTVEEWLVAENAAVLRAAETWAARHGLTPPTLAQVQAASDYASGSVDYGAKWAYALARIMTARGPRAAGASEVR